VRKYSILYMHNIAKRNGGKCLSEAYVNKRTILQWECTKGHRWEAFPDSVLRGSWCAVCSGTMRLSLDDMQALAKERGGKCLSEFYVNNKTKLLWKCASGHQWEAAPNSIKRGNWCPTCAGVNQPTIEEMNEIAQERGGRCLSAQYLNNITKLLWECAKKHRWAARPHDIKRGSWCPRCYSINRSKMKEMRELALKKKGNACPTHMLTIKPNYCGNAQKVINGRLHPASSSVAHGVLYAQ